MMPVQLVCNEGGRALVAGAACGSGAGRPGSADSCLHIGLINNMPDGALEATERQFLTLLGLAANRVAVHLSLYALPEVPRTESGRLRISRSYSSVQSLGNSQLDGLIVTGAEPQACNLTDEPYWGSLARVLDWAEYNTWSTVWSCLAAHAALQHIDGVGRRRLSEKRFGVFECARASGHQLTSGLSPRVYVPHSRWNDIPEDELTDCGYRVLTRIKDGGIDTFVKQRRSLFVFFQGHPEYETNTLLLEYRRDVGRYLRRERETFPTAPEGYFDRNTRDLVTTLRERALSDRSQDVLMDLPTALVENRIANTWSPVAVQVYANWIAYLSEQKLRNLRSRRCWTARAGALQTPDSGRVERRW
jgi:homoserine O-succinyltransferase